MKISANDWKRYTDALRKVNELAIELINGWIEYHGGLPTTLEELNSMIDFAYSVSGKYGEAAAALAAEMYDAIAAASGVVLDSALPAATPEMSEVAKTIVGTLKTQNDEIVAAAIGRLVKQVGVDTMMQNAIRDGAEWAWIPSGDSCPFCIMLASNGWQRASRKALKNGHAEHIHANCDCTYAVRFNSNDNVAGYDPEAYYDRYQNAEGRDWREKLNSMRREDAAENGD